jgi:hypothetical protein
MLSGKIKAELNYKMQLVLNLFFADLDTTDVYLLMQK